MSVPSCSQVRVFTYLVGRSGEDATLREIACRNRGQGGRACDCSQRVLLLLLCCCC